MIQNNFHLLLHLFETTAAHIRFFKYTVARKQILARY